MALENGGTADGMLSERGPKSRRPSLDLDSLLSLARHDSYVHCSLAPHKHELHPTPSTRCFSARIFI